MINWLQLILATLTFTVSPIQTSVLSAENMTEHDTVAGHAVGAVTIAIPNATIQPRALIEPPALSLVLAPLVSPAAPRTS